MAERTDRNTDPYLEHLERQQKRDAWFAQKKHEREEQERADKRAALEAHLAERARTFIDHTGSTPTTAVLEDWTRQYLDGQERVRQAERERKMAEVEAQDHYHPHI